MVAVVTTREQRGNEESHARPASPVVPSAALRAFQRFVLVLPTPDGEVVFHQSTV